MAYQMKGNKKPGSSYKNQGNGEGFENKGLTGHKVTYDDEGNAINPDVSMGELTKGTTVLPEFEVGSDGSSKINFGLDGNEEKTRNAFDDTVGEAMKKEPSSRKAFMESLSSMTKQQRKRDMFDFDRVGIPREKHSNPKPTRGVSDLIENIGNQQQSNPQLNLRSKGNNILTQPHHTLTKKSGKEKAISKKRYDRLAPKLEKKKNPKRSVSDKSIIERLMGK